MCLTYMHLLSSSGAKRGTVPPSSQSPTLALTLIKRDMVLPISPRSPLVPAVFGTGSVGLPAPNHTLSLFLRPCKHGACYSWSNPGPHTLTTPVHRCMHAYIDLWKHMHPHSHVYAHDLTVSEEHLFPYSYFLLIIDQLALINSCTCRMN